MNRYGLIILLGSLCSTIVAMDDRSFECSLALSQDVPGLVRLMNEEGHQEEGIVVPPKRFREEYFQGAVENQELYIIKLESEIVGYKKLFLMDNEPKKHSILESEIRCVGEHSKPLLKGTVRVFDKVIIFSTSSDEQPVSERPVYIYNGGDFTKKAYRGRGLNKLLMQSALDAVKAKTEVAIEAEDSDALSMVYGITESNGAFDPGSKCDRTLPIVKSFVPFAQSIARQLKRSNADTEVVYHERFAAYKPSFAENADEFTPLSDASSVPGAGVVLTYPLKKKKGE